MRYAIRRLIHQPGFSLVVILTLALGIGANTAIFSLVNAVLLKPLPYDRPEQLVTVNHFYPNLNDFEGSFAVPSYHDIRERMRLFQSFAVMTPWNANLTEGGDPEKVIGAVATAEFFKVFRVAPLLGRTFAEGEDTDGRRHVVVELTRGRALFVRVREHADVIEADLVDEPGEQLIKVAEIDGVPGDRGHVGVHRKKEGQRLAKVGRRSQLEELGSLPKRLRVVR